MNGARVAGLLTVLLAAYGWAQPASAPRLLIFWRSDCAPCRTELKTLPEIARASAPVPVELVALNDAPAPSLPDGVTMRPATTDAQTLLRTYGDKAMALPFAVALHADGTLCESHYGLLGTDRVKEWATRC